VHYTTDGSEPTAASPVYGGPVAVPASPGVVRVLVVREGREVLRMERRVGGTGDTRSQ
jgi:hypothetical protein